MSGKRPDKRVLEPFNIFEETYKTVDFHDIKAAVLIPKTLKPGKHPIIINIHGGFLTMGSSLFVGFFSPWLSSLSVKHGAVIVSADYRLLPTKRGAIDPLEDLEDFWQWTRSSLNDVLARHAPGHSVDMGRLLLTGSSAGGYYGAQLGLSHPDDISVLAMQYPYIDPKDDVYTKGPEKNAPTVLRFPKEKIPSEEAGLRWAEEAKEKPVTQCGYERCKSNVSLTTYGHFHSKVFDPLGTNAVETLPLERIRAGAKMPRKIWLLHGTDDPTIYVRQSHKFLALAKEKLPESEIRYDEALGQEHEFDLLNPDWETFAVGSLGWVTRAWLHSEPDLREPKRSDEPIISDEPARAML